MSKTWFGHYIENIKGDDYVLFTDYVELEQKIDRLNNELDQYKNNWEELKKWLEQEWLEWKDCEDTMTKNFATEDKTILNKMKELEEKNND